MADSATHILTGKLAVEKIRTFAFKAELCTMVTGLTSMLFNARCMYIALTDSTGSFYFLSHKHSTKNADITASNETQIILSCKNEYLTLYGVTGIYDLREQIKAVYDPVFNAWFEGPDDPNLTIIRFQPFAGHWVHSTTQELIHLSAITDEDFERRVKEEGESDEDGFSFSLN